MFSRRSLLVSVTLALLSVRAEAQVLGQPLVVILIGPPASGKTTQADYLNKKYKLPVVSIENLIAAHTGNASVALKRSDPAVDELVKSKLSSIDTSRGFALDGYPATRAQADYLASLTEQMLLPRPIVIQIRIPDQVAHERARARGGERDSPEEIARRLSEYHREMDVIRAYFPKADIWTIDGTRPVRGVSATIRLLIEERTQ